MTPPATAFVVLLLAVSPGVGAMEHEGGRKDCPMHDAAATPQDRARHLDEMFAKLDADGNGAIDRAEFDQHHEDMRRGHEATAPAADEHAGHR